MGKVWETIKNAQENIIQLINLCSSQCQPDESAAKLATLIIQVYDSKDETAIDIAKDEVKNEVRKTL